ncbi:hypothetical protein LEN26_012679 [Aphanomyces euteiches]|nr:hypothetical protein LEN26_012679 [Aphanomyces euteiches]KAH9128705.1 hypothetical protein AeMF1_001166 [Aphanomyces euteiches]
MARTSIVTNVVEQHIMDEGTARCRLPLSFLQAHRVSEGAAVAVFTESACFLCRAHAMRRSSVVTFDRSISIPPSHSLVNKLARERVSDDIEIVIVIPNGVRPAASVSLTFVEDQTYPDDAADLVRHPISLRVLQDACRRLIVHDSCIVRLPHPNDAPHSPSKATLQFRVHKTLPAGVVQIMRATRIAFLLPDSPAAPSTDQGIPNELQNHRQQSIGGLDKELKQLEELIYMAVEFPDPKRQLGIPLPKGVLLSGPPGVGKTLLVRTATQRCHESGKCQLALRVINGAEILSGGPGEAESALRLIFADGRQFTQQSPKNVFCLFLDELDALCPQRERSGRSHSRIVAQLLTLMDGIDDSRSRIIVFGATNLPNAIDPALRRPGRFDREVMVQPPGVDDRAEIFKIHLANLPLDKQVDVDTLAIKLAEISVGYVGADIAALCRQACIIALTRLQNVDTPRVLKFLRNQQLSAMYWNNQTMKNVDIADVLSQLSLDDKSNNFVTMEDFMDAAEFIQASVLRGAKTFRKDKSEQTTWDDIGGLENVKLSLQQAVEWPLKYPGTFQRLNIKPPRGILLYGPPGCSKSTIVRACAYASQATFLSLSAAEVFSPYFGDAEAAIRQVFRDARAATPAIVFMDEIDAIVSKREFEQGGSGGSGMALRVLSTLLNEMDGVESADGLLVVGATNRPDMIDAALLRPGRFDRVVYVPLPEANDRLKILQIHTKNAKLAENVNLDWIASKAHFFSGAELENVCREAALLALREDIHTQEISMRHFENALEHISPVSCAKSLIAFEEFQAKQESGQKAK